MAILSNTTQQIGRPVAEPIVDTELPTFQFIVGWVLLFTILIFISRTRLGYVAIYYSLLMMILIILVTEYRVITPYLNAIQSIGSFNASQATK
jgi:type IV secretory pathway VirB3-like protein